MGKNLDKELADAAGLGDESDGDVMAVPQPAEPTREPLPGKGRKANVGLLAMLLVMVAGIVCLFMFGFKDAQIYAMPVDEFIARSNELGDRRVRLDGELIPGTLVKRDDPCEYRFTMRGTEQKLSSPPRACW